MKICINDKYIKEYKSFRIIPTYEGDESDEVFYIEAVEFDMDYGDEDAVIGVVNGCDNEEKEHISQEIINKMLVNGYLDLKELVYDGLVTLF